MTNFLILANGKSRDQVPRFGCQMITRDPHPPRIRRLNGEQLMRMKRADSGAEFNEAATQVGALEYISISEHESILHARVAEARVEALGDAVKECDAWLDLMETDHRAKIKDNSYPDPQEGGREYRNICNMVSAVRAGIKTKAKAARDGEGNLSETPNSSGGKP